MEQQHAITEGITKEACQKQYTDADGPFLIHVVRLYPTQDGYRERVDLMDIIPNTVQDADMLLEGLAKQGEVDIARGVLGGRYVTAFYEPFGCPRPWTRSLLGMFQRQMVRQAIEIANKRGRPEHPAPDPEYMKTRLETLNQLMGYKGVTA